MRAFAASDVAGLSCELLSVRGKNPDGDVSFIKAVALIAEDEVGVYSVVVINPDGRFVGAGCQSDQERKQQV